LNADIVDAMSTVKEPMLSPAGTVPEPVADVDAEADVLAEVAGAVVELVELDDEHPASARPMTAAVSPTQPSRRKPPKVRSPCEWEDRPPPVLIPFAILISLRLNAPG